VASQREDRSAAATQTEPGSVASDCVRARLTVTSSTLINEPPPGGVKKR
jgi:hypothetical protein